MIIRIVLSLFVVALNAFSGQLLAASYADIIIDADKYEVLSEQNSETLLHPAAVLGASTFAYLQPKEAVK